MIDLSTGYMGLQLANPLVASASPLTESADNVRRMEDAGISAVVLPSLFQEQLDVESSGLDQDLNRGGDAFYEAQGYLPNLANYNTGPDGYLERIARIKRAVRIPVIASFNGTTPSGWIRYVHQMEEAGANAIELNIYAIETNPFRSGDQVEADYVSLVRQIKMGVRIPVAVKLTPFFSAMTHMATCLVKAGADALVLFNRFYQPDFDLEKLEVIPRLALSTSEDLLMRLHWIAILYGNVNASLAVTGGVHTAEDVLKSVMAGADVAMTTSALLKNGIGHARHILTDLEHWMQEHEYESIRQMKGSMSHRSVADPAALERGNYMRVLSSYQLRPRV
jgi:dihydroorotate dehydrogenase (fumarate)